MPPAPARRADGTVSPTGRRRSAQPLIVICQAKAKADALDGLERWKKRHPKAAKHLAEDDVLVDGMRGRSSLWYRVRVNLRHVPEKERPAEEKPDPDYDLSQEWRRLTVTIDGAFHPAVRNDPHHSHGNVDRHRPRGRHEGDLGGSEARTYAAMVSTVSSRPGSARCVRPPRRARGPGPARPRQTT